MSSAGHAVPACANRLRGHHAEGQGNYHCMFNAFNSIVEVQESGSSDFSTTIVALTVSFAINAGEEFAGAAGTRRFSPIRLRGFATKTSWRCYQSWRL